MNVVLDRLLAMRRAGVVEAIDQAFAEWVRTRDGRPIADAGAVALAACLVSRAAGGGDVALELGGVAGRAPWPEQAGDLVAPELDPWIAALRASPAVAVDPVPDAVLDRPLVLRGTRLALTRFDAYENGLADRLAARGSTATTVAPEADIESALARLFGDPVPAEAAAQRDAARVAVSSGLTVISGGPGTGKTTTVVKILALIGTVSRSPPKIRLAAPTGKAAARLGASVVDGKRAIAEAGAASAEALDAIPESASTVHRLIGAVPGGRPPRFGRERRLPVDVVVIDEASMLDLALTARVLDALPDDACLILLGDRDQLASVQAGAVLGDVCAAAERPGSPLDGRVTYLTHSFRFREDGGIGRVAAAIRSGDADGALAALRTDDPEVGIEDGEDVRGPVEALLVEGYAPYIDAISGSPMTGAAIAAALDAFDRFRVLCAVKAGPRGVVAVNRLAEDRFRVRLAVSRRTPWYRGRPVLVTRNDRSVRRFNGDVGITVPVVDEHGDVSLRVAFRDEHGGVRTLSPARLPEHETCWAMTIHKSQGSEFDRVALVLPDIGPTGPSPVATRELVYTGVTRARRRVDLFATEEAFRAAVERPTVRASGLREALARPRDGLQEQVPRE